MTSLYVGNLAFTREQPVQADFSCVGMRCVFNQRHAAGTAGDAGRYVAVWEMINAQFAMHTGKSAHVRCSPALYRSVSPSSC